MNTTTVSDQLNRKQKAEEEKLKINKKKKKKNILTFWFFHRHFFSFIFPSRFLYSLTKVTLLEYFFDSFFLILLHTFFGKYLIMWIILGAFKYYILTRNIVCFSGAFGFDWCIRPYVFYKISFIGHVWNYFSKIGSIYP